MFLRASILFTRQSSHMAALVCLRHPDLISTNLQIESLLKSYYRRRGSLTLGSQSSTAHGILMHPKICLRFMNGEQFARRQCSPTNRHKILLPLELRWRSQFEDDSLTVADGTFLSPRHSFMGSLSTYQMSSRGPR